MLEKLKPKINQKSFRIGTSILVIFMIFNITISCAAAERQAERGRNKKPENQWDMFLDEHYPDDYMNEVFANKIPKY